MKVYFKFFKNLFISFIQNLSETYKREMSPSSIGQNQNQQKLRRIRVHTRKKLLKCELCPYSCKHEQSLQKHMCTHTSKAPYKSETCSCSFAQQQIHTHTVKKLFKCKICSSSFSQKPDLLQHMRTHIRSLLHSNKEKKEKIKEENRNLVNQLFNVGTVPSFNFSRGYWEGWKGELND